MLNITSHARIYAYTKPADMRKGFNGLSGIIRSEFQSDPTDGSLFLFVNRRRDRMKLLHFDGGGFWLYYRLFESGTFEQLVSKGDSCRLQIGSTELTMLLSGVSLKAFGRRRKRFDNKAV